LQPHINPIILYNAISTPDGTILESLTRNDYKIHQDTTDGFHYAIDGGTFYRGREGGQNAVELSVVDDGTMTIEEVRKHLRWGTYGKEGNEPLRFVKLMDMDDDHLEATIAHVEERINTIVASGSEEIYKERLESLRYYLRRFEEEQQLRTQ